jgi:asparagine N-glycosylation enzyme membrane subunit Stt3
MNRYRLAFVIDVVELWMRKGGRYSLFALIALALSLTSDDTFARSLAFVLTPVAVVFAAIATVSVIKSLKVWKRGLGAEGRVTRIEKSSTHSTRLNKARVVFHFRVDGRDIEAKSTWGSPGRTGLLAPGGRLEILYDPDDPERAFWRDDLPISFPPIAF